MKWWLAVLIVIILILLAIPIINGEPMTSVYEFDPVSFSYIPRQILPFDFSKLITETSKKCKETFAVIRRARGPYGGVIDSFPIFDYKNTFKTGDTVWDCDECPNPTVCPHCPQIGATDSHGPIYNLTDYLDKTDSYGGSYYVENLISGGGAGETAAYFGQGESVERNIDIPEGREAIGAGTPGKKIGSSPWARVTNMSTEDTKCEIQNTFGLKCGNPADGESLRLLYVNTMGLEAPGPAQPELEYYGFNGYLYKQPAQEI